MKKDYKEFIAKFFPSPPDEENLEKILCHVIFKNYSAGTILLTAGTIPSKLFLVVKGCLRVYFIKDNGDEITAQFFVEDQVVSSFESTMTGTPSRLYIDAVEDSIIGIIPLKQFKKLIQEYNQIKDEFFRIIIVRLINYMNLYASFILDKPEQRYKKFIQENPDLASRLPQHLVASYLGITPVSLSRIRGRLRKKINNC